jgi:RNA polymerase sigma-70 factor, ECF subfamily
LNFFPNLKRFFDLKGVSDEELVEGFKEGKKRYYEELYKRYYKLIYKIAYTGFSDEGDAREITDETFLRSLKGIRTFRGEASFKTWLNRILINLIIEKRSSLYYRNTKKNIPLDIIDNEQKDDYGSIPILQISDNKDLLKQICSAEAKENLKKAISSLNDINREVLELSLFGLEYKEIAELENIPVGTVKSRISNARKKVIALMISYYQDKKETLK